MGIKNQTSRIVPLTVWILLLTISLSFGALSRIKSYVHDEVLTHSDLNASINNILNNALSLISPLTGNLDCNSKELQNLILEKLGADGTGVEGQQIYNTADDHAKLYNDSGYQFLVDVPDAGSSGEFVKTDGTDWDWSKIDITDSTQIASLDSVVKAWGNLNGTGTAAWNDKFNIDASVTDNGTGNYSITWTTDFASTNYVVVGGVDQDHFVSFDSYATTGCNVYCSLHDGASADKNNLGIIVIGDQ